jgi:adenylylsulfate kinase-like enzyme
MARAEELPGATRGLGQRSGMSPDGPSAARQDVVVLVVITGQIASGKSTVACAIARELERDGASAAVVDLDVIYEMLDPECGPKVSQAKWTHARQLAARIAGALLAEGVLVVVEGEFLTPDQRAEFTDALPSAIAPRFVTLRLPFEVALQRTSADPSRALSRDPTFLASHYEATAESIERIPSSDLMLDTSAFGVEEAARKVAGWLGQSR